MGTAHRFIIKYANSRIEKKHKSLPDDEINRVDKAFEQLKINPFYTDHKHIKKLRGKLKGKRRWDINDLRIIYSIDGTSRIVYILDIDKRGQIYK
jgi:mRNA-degrading endonuclease RelE of RelBE toxin-antitoxin system